ncbi:hypothetical protein Pmani_009235 [Petrolisthes manimaculis]|uniref:Uncharacterized protein n=1 Tax=Petrolisthes manimaculis TaxID=1843537 RepID=A0AAE1UD26_9EUCA|nr:hypothetical protein Pmani_009235 [Petrolisthes manimaculis]
MQASTDATMDQEDDEDFFNVLLNEEVSSVPEQVKRVHTSQDEHFDGPPRDSSVPEQVKRPHPSHDEHCDGPPEKKSGKKPKGEKCLYDFPINKDTSEEMKKRAIAAARSKDYRTKKDEKMKDLKNENQNLKNENQNLKDENQNQKNESLNMKNENQNLKNENQNQKNENQNLKNENQNLKNENQNLKNTIQELNTFPGYDDTWYYEKN